MITSVKLERELFGGIVKQDSKTGYFSATDLLQAGNKWRVSNDMAILKFEDWTKKASTKEFIAELEKHEGKQVYIAGRGRGTNTWVHPFIFIDLALWISPKLKIEVYSWLYDCLVKYRNQSGDSYKKMCGALYITENNKSVFSKHIQEIAKKIKNECKVDDWETATEYQLKLRDKIHEYIAVLSDVLHDRETLISVAVKKAKDELEKTK